MAIDKYQNYNIENLDNAIEALHLTRLDLLKETMEFLGFDLDYNSNEFGYKNYLINNPLQIPGLGGFTIDSEFVGAGNGKLPIPSGFYSDQLLYEFITHAEGAIGVQWVSEYKGHNIVRSAGCFGYDFPGGVHDPSYIKLLGLSQSDGDSLGITNNGRKPIGAEYYGGAVQWGWYTNPLPPSHPYWQKLIPYYRDAMIWAWNQPEIQAIKSPGERLARMHTINWYGHHNMRGLTYNDVGWPHRLKVAQEVCGG